MTFRPPQYPIAGQMAVNFTIARSVAERKLAMINQSVGLDDLRIPHSKPLEARMALQVPAPRINDIVRERRAINVDTALRLAKLFGNIAEFWLGLQTDHVMAEARLSLPDAIDRIR